MSNPPSPPVPRRVLETLWEYCDRALAVGEVPVAAVVFQGEDILGVAFNHTRTSHLATAHSELLAIEAACRSTGQARLPNASILTSLEPCLMCSGAIVQARLKTVYYCTDTEAGIGLGALLNLPSEFDRGKGINHRPRLVHLANERERAARLLREFFARRRKK